MKHIIERTTGEAVRIGACTLRVVAVTADGVKLALLGPLAGCVCCGKGLAELRECLRCGAVTALCPACVPSHRCPRCGAESAKE